MSTSPFRSLRHRWFWPVLLVLTLVVSVQKLHLPGSQQDDVPAGDVEIAAAVQHEDHDGAGAAAECSESLCSLCVAVVSRAMGRMPRVAVHRHEFSSLSVLAAPAERLYRPPIHTA